MSKRAPKLPPPTDAEREQAALSAAAIRAAIADPVKAGEHSTAHLNTGRRRQHLWLSTWSNLPGLTFEFGSRTYSHTLLPGWEYTIAEMKTEMLDDLDALARDGIRPTEASR